MYWLITALLLTGGVSNWTLFDEPTRQQIAHIMGNECIEYDMYYCYIGTAKTAKARRRLLHIAALGDDRWKEVEMLLDKRGYLKDGD